MGMYLSFHSIPFFINQILRELRTIRIQIKIAMGWNRPRSILVLHLTERITLIREINII